MEVNMLTIKRAQVEDAEEITKIKTVAFNKDKICMIFLKYSPLIVRI